MKMNISAAAKLNNGVEIPFLGLGVYQIPEGDETRRAVLAALRTGYRHIDTARLYANEHSVGEAIRESGIPREEIFITTKLWNSDQGYERALNAFEDSRQKLGVEYIDLYLIHWPVENLRLESWKALEKLYADGKVKAIGVSNFMVRHMIELLAHSEIVPAINQVELSPYNYQTRKGVVDFCKSRGIAVEAYSPLTKGHRLNDPRLQEIAGGYGISSAQLLIRWALQHEFVTIPKSEHEDRIRENSEVFDFSINEEDMELLDSLDEKLVTAWDPTHTP